MDPVTCEDFEDVLRGGGDIPVYAGTISQRGGLAIGGGVRGFIGSVLPIVKSVIGKAVKRNVSGIIADKMLRGMTLQESVAKRGRNELGKVMRDVANVVSAPPPKKRKTANPVKKTKKKKITVKGRTPSRPGRTRAPDIFG